ncbi:DegV family protein [Gemella sp. zg-570]|uniref:DegV family protein n=1 Tax=Gemella sp. zg-570 TaxID=2840371 RepID=UPI001C0BD3E0|nr:DegV family protein [Gemella sp. zg-570]QWQ38318.1 DegV family protein [Gemella sp. zg-570]
MKKIAILVDSTAYLTEEFRKKENLRVVYLTITLAGRTRRELLDIKLDEYQKYLTAENKVFPTTSQPPIGEVVIALEKFKEEGYTDVIAIGLSSGISGTYSSYNTAALMVAGINVHPFDSEVSCQAEGFYVTKTCKLIEEGKNPKEIIAELNEMKKNSKALFIVDDLSHLQRGGRLSQTQALVGNLLQVKPILHFDNKVIVPYQKIRTYKKAINKIYEVFGEFYSENKGKNIHVCIIHTKAEDRADDMEDYIKENYPDVKILKDEIGPVIATHLGLGAIGFAWTVL